jgi:hypothetical protein
MMTKTEIQERIEIEQEKRARALEKWNSGELPRRIARRIIKRCNERISGYVEKHVDIEK